MDAVSNNLRSFKMASISDIFIMFNPLKVDHKVTLITIPYPLQALVLNFSKKDLASEQDDGMSDLKYHMV